MFQKANSTECKYSGLSNSLLLLCTGLIQGYAASNTSLKEVILLVVSSPCLHTAITLIYPIF